MIKFTQLPVIFIAITSLASACKTDKVRASDDIKKYVRHFDERMSTPNGRMAILTELTYFHPRNSKLYPPFFEQFLSDPSAKLRWEALSRLDDHGITVPASKLPQSVRVPLVGLLDRKNKDSIAHFKKLASQMEATGGWAIKALGLMRVEGANDLAETLLDSENIFVRHSAAVALINFGEVDIGKKVLRQIAEQGSDPSGFYRSVAAERLFRLGEKQYIEILFDTFSVRLGYADGAIGVLNDLTGEYFCTEEEWRNWWSDHGKKEHMNAGQQAGAEQPATAPESKPESEKKSKPESEGRSR